MKPTKSQIQKASNKAAKNMIKVVSEMSNARRGDWQRLWNSIMFTPSKLRGDK